MLNLGLSPAEPVKTILLKNSFSNADSFTLNGECVYTSPSVMEIRDYCLKDQDTMWDETRRFANPHEVYVDLSSKLYDIKISLLDEMSKD